MTFLDNIRTSSLMPRIGRQDLARAWAQRPSLMFGLCAVTLIAALLLGGGTRAGFLSDTILELIAIPAFLVAVSALIAMPRVDRQDGVVWVLTLCLAIAVLPLLQLVPLPPWIWTRLPYRDEIASVFALVHEDLPWLPISVSPSLTWAGVLSLLPPFAVFLGVIQLSYRERRALSLILIALGIISALLGLLQVAQGQSSPWRFFAVTNPTEAVGFFANRNHLAALLNSVLLFGAAWAVQVGYSVGHWRERRNIETASVVALTASFLGLVILIAAEGSSRSRAGVGLLIVALFGAFMLAVMDRRRSSTSTPVKLILGSAIIAILLVLQFSLYRLLDRFDDPLENTRIQFAQNTIHAAEAYMPFGSGFGTFTAVYPSFEPPQDVLDNRYVNHAHDDVLELWLEGGVMSLLLMAAFLTWLVTASRRAWRRPRADSHSIDVLLARAATIVVPIILVHSVFDYPLRTDAMMAVFAFSCALLVRPLELVARQGTQPQLVRGRESVLQLAPAREISEAEKRRLARLKGEVVPEDPSESPEMPKQEVLDNPNELTDDSAVVPEATDDDPFAELPADVPVDLDELADLTQTDPVIAPASSASQRRGKTEPIGEMGSLLAELNRTELVPRSDIATSGSGNAKNSAGAATDRISDLAQRRLKILRNVKLVASPGVEMESKPSPGSSARPPPGSEKSMEQSAVPLEPAQRRLQALRAVERFIQTSEPATLDAAQPPDAVSQETPEPTNGSDSVKPTVDLAATNAPHHLESAAEPDLVADSAATGAGGEAGIGSPPPSVPTAITELSQELTEPEPQEEVAAPTIGTEVFSEIVQPTVESSRTLPDEAGVIREEMPASSETDALSDSPQLEEQWSDELEGPRQRRPDSGDNASRVPPHADQDVGAEPLVAREPAGENSPETVADSLTPARAPAETKPTPNRRPKGAAQAQVPVLAPRGRPASHVPATSFTESPAVPDQSRWGNDIEWPEEWRK